VGNCKYCSRPAGLLRTAHTDCETGFKLAWLTIGRYLMISLEEGQPQDELIEAIQEIAADTNFPPQVTREIIRKGWGSCAESARARGCLTKDEECCLLAVRDHFALSQHVPGLRQARSKRIRVTVMREVEDEYEWMFWVH
jgi:hypothetical protein